jgi:hypothetical protein
VSISIESRHEVTWRSNVENWLYDVKYSKSQPLKSQCQSKIKCGNYQALAEPHSFCASYRVFWYSVQWSRPKLDSMVWSQLSSSKGSVASAKTSGWVARMPEYEESLSWCRGCGHSASWHSSFSTNLLIRSFCVASSCSRLTGKQSSGGGALPHGAWPRPRVADPTGMSRIGSLEVLIRTICHNELCIIRYLQMSSRMWCENAYGKHNVKEWQLHLQKVTSIFHCNLEKQICNSEPKQTAVRTKRKWNCS